MTVSKKSKLEITVNGKNYILKRRDRIVNIGMMYIIITQNEPVTIPKSKITHWLKNEYLVECGTRKGLLGEVYPVYKFAKFPEK